jgi:outer membrane immunogenic protein
LGYLPTNNLLVYGTGGFAYGRMKQDIAYNNNTGAPSNFDGACPTGPATCYAGSSARFATGWTAGGGFEYALMNNWTVRAEYLYVNLAGNTLPESVLGGVFPGFAPSTINAQYDDLALHLVRAGMNYKF